MTANQATRISAGPMTVSSPQSMMMIMMMEDITTAIDDAYHIPEVRVWLRE